MTIKEQIIEQLDTLNESQQREVLDTIARVKNRPQGTPGRLAVQIAREIGFSHEDLAQMEQAIEEAFENIDDFPEVNLDQ